jgi:DNA (cytosine-5)-methyltransferase 1
MFEQINIFEGHVPFYKITKPIKLIELFAGIGSQHQALKNLGVKVEHSTIVEWQVNSIQAYNDIHVRKYTNWTKDMTKEEIAYRLHELGVSIDYNQPARLETLLRKGDEWLRNVYNNIINTNNKVNIMSVKASHLNIVDTDKYDYILTYSFPCQDLSKAGKGKGMSDKTTRSGLLWEVERILTECEELPQVLLMENVPDVIGTRYINDFRKWDERLRELGYTNHIQVLNSKDYGIPQNRERAFMVSILGNYLYKFPNKQPLTLRLKDMLEKEVDEKYYLSDTTIERISQWKAQQDPFDTMEKTDKLGISPTLTARGAGEDHSGMILVKEEVATLDEYNGTIKQDGTIGTIVATQSKMGHGHSVIEPSLVIPEDTIKADSNDIGVVVNPLKDKTEYGWHFEQNVYDENGLTRTLKASEGSGNIPKVITSNNLHIRKLTPKECYRLMGFDDEAYDRAEVNQSNSSLYHQAGDSIVVNVLMGIFKELI